MIILNLTMCDLLASDPACVRCAAAQIRRLSGESRGSDQTRKRLFTGSLRYQRRLAEGPEVSEIEAAKAIAGLAVCLELVDEEVAFLWVC